MSDHLCPQWRTVLCARNPRNRVALSNDDDDPYTLSFGWLGTLVDMEGAGWLERVADYQPLHVYQIPDAKLALIQHGKQRLRLNKEQRSGTWSPITVESALVVRETICDHLKLPYHTAPQLVTAPKSFTLLFTHRLTAAQITDLIALVNPITMTNRWYSGTVLRPATQEYHATWWTK